MIKDSVISVRKLLCELELDALLFLNLHNIRYVTGFSGSDGAAIISSDSAVFLTDSRYTTQAGLEVSGFEITEYQSKIAGIVSYLEKGRFARIGFEGEDVSVTLHDTLSRKLPGQQFQPLSRELYRLRIAKSPDELEELRATAAIASQAVIDLLPTLKPGMREKDFALELEFAMRRGGADDKSFDFIVASGVRGALPHGKASEKPVAMGELVTIDFGAIRNGYCSDETITVAMGPPDELQRKIYTIVKDAHDFALEAVKPGVACKDLDAKARNYIEAQGYGKYFGHGLGHGVGLEVHEKPVLSFRSDDIAEEGMVFTVEPGIYIPGWGGVRIEDTVRVTADGFEVLTKVPKDLKILCM